MSLVAALSARSAMENVCADSNGTVALVWKPTDMEHVTKLVHAQNNVLREVYAELQLHRCDELLHERASQCCKDVCIPAPRVRHLLHDITRALRLPQPEILSCVGHVVNAGTTSPATTSAVRASPDAATVNGSTPAAVHAAGTRHSDTSRVHMADDEAARLCDATRPAPAEHTITMESGASGVPCDAANTPHAMSRTHSHATLSKPSVMPSSAPQPLCDVHNSNNSNNDIHNYNNNNNNNKSSNHHMTDNEAHTPLSIVCNNDMERDEERAAVPAPNHHTPHSLDNHSSHFANRYYCYNGARIAVPRDAARAEHAASHAHNRPNDMYAITPASATASAQNKERHWFVHIQSHPVNDSKVNSSISNSNRANDASAAAAPVCATHTPNVTVYPAREDRSVHVPHSQSTTASAEQTRCEAARCAACDYHVEQEVQRMVHDNIRRSRARARRSVSCQTGEQGGGDPVKQEDGVIADGSCSTGSARVCASVPFMVHGESISCLRCSVATQCGSEGTVCRHTASCFSGDSIRHRQKLHITSPPPPPCCTNASSTRITASAEATNASSSAQVNSSASTQTMRSCVSQSCQLSHTPRPNDGGAGAGTGDAATVSGSTPTRRGLCRQQRGRRCSARRVRPEWDNNFALPAPPEQEDVRPPTNTPHPAVCCGGAAIGASGIGRTSHRVHQDGVTHADAHSHTQHPCSMSNDANEVNECSERTRAGPNSVTVSPRRGTCLTSALHLRTAPSRRCSLTYKGLDSRGIETALYGSPVVSNSCIESTLLNDAESVKAYMAAEDAKLRVQEQLHQSMLQEQIQLQQMAQSRQRSPTMSLVRQHSSQRMRRRLPSGALVPLTNSSRSSLLDSDGWHDGNNSSSSSRENIGTLGSCRRAERPDEQRCARTPVRRHSALTCTQRQLQAERSLLENQVDKMYQELIRSTQFNNEQGNEIRYEQLKQRIARVQADLKRVNNELNTVTNLESCRAREERLPLVQPFAPLSF